MTNTATTTTPVVASSLEAADTVKLMVALNRAWLPPFDSNDWQSWGGAMGQAHTVVFHPHDHKYFLRALGMAHVPPEYVTVILDDAGISWNIHSPVNGYAWMVQVQLVTGIAEGPTEQEFWQTDKQRPYGGKLEQQIATLPPEVRLMVLACPYEAQPHVVAGYLAANPPKPTAAQALRAGTVHLVRGVISGHLPEQAHLPPGTTEWQFCNGPAGNRGYSEDYVDLAAGLAEFDGCAISTVEADFTPAERAIFNNWAATSGRQSTVTMPANPAAPLIDGRPAAWVARRLDQQA